ncbi:MAG: hypothetical protein IJ597_02490 [Synergistaceae bacterium]|nr:hypothetical protein [Synergistaceae bacterium]
MTKESLRTRFHYGFYAAMEVEYDLANIPLIYEQEIELGKDPVRLDFLIIKKNSDIVMSDPIGEFFKQVNIFEYKSPEDGLSIDDFYKVQGYALIYKGFGRKVNELPIENITLTIVRHIYPRELLKDLKKSGVVINNIHPGIYRFEGKLSIPVQLVVSSLLPPDEYEGLKLLSSGATVDDIISYTEKAIASDNERIKENVGTVIEVCLAVNKNIEEDKRMYEEVRRVFKNLFEEERLEGRNAEKERVAIDMLKENYPLSAIAKISKLSENVIRNLATSLGLAVS